MTATRYLLDVGLSRFTVQAFARGMLSVFAHNPTFVVRDFTGELLFDPDRPGDGSFQMTVRADSLVLADPVSAKDRAEIEGRMRAEVLETAAYPEVRFRSTDLAADQAAAAAYRLRLRGELSLHGVTNRQQIDAQLRLFDDGMRLSGACLLSLSAYHLKRVAALGGMIQLKDELRFLFDLAGRKEGP